jgi:hypothetical protein
MMATGHRWFVNGVARYDPSNFGKAELICYRLCDFDVGTMDRIKPATEEPKWLILSSLRFFRRT